jgi:RNA polymerase sigma-70 factor (ECF subfamily)
MTGSFFDGEDVLQEALLKAHDAARHNTEAIENPGGWLFRIAHRTALDHIRRRQRSPVVMDEAVVQAVEPHGEATDAERRWAVGAALRTFLSLTPAQRGAVILVDVLEYSLEEVATMTQRSIAATKSALLRGRLRLREVAAPPAPSADTEPLRTYARLFNAREFDRLRDMLAEEVRVELVAATTIDGRTEVAARYFGNYGRTADWQAQAARVDGRAALVISRGVEEPYVIELVLCAGLVTAIRDFRHAGYELRGADIAFV